MKTRIAAGRIAPRPQIACGGTKRMEERLSVLVVDDDREIVESIAIYLSRENLQIYKAYDGLQALDVVAGHTIHLILMDVMMPRLDGIKAMLKLLSLIHI